MINEIEVPKKSVTIHTFIGQSDLPLAILESTLASEENSYIPPTPDNENGQGGFVHPYADNGFLRSEYSFPHIFEHEELKDGIQTKRIARKIKSCEILMDAQNNRLYAWGDASAIKCAIRTLAASAQIVFQKLDFSTEDMMRVESRMHMVKSIGIQNPKSCPIRKVKLTGRIENYVEYKDTINLGSHSITSVQGIVEKDQLQFTLNVTPKGIFRLTIRPGFSVTTDLLLWIERLTHPGE